MLDDCITKLQELDRHCHQVNEMTPDMHKEFEKALIELLHHSVTENKRAISTIRKLQHELEFTRSGLKTLMTELHN